MIHRIAQDSKRTAAKWAKKIAAAVAQLERFPEIGSIVEEVDEPEYREQIVGPYRVIYLFNGTDCVIVAVLRAEQDLRSNLDPGPTS